MTENHRGPSAAGMSLGGGVDAAVAKAAAGASVLPGDRYSLSGETGSTDRAETCRTAPATLFTA
ncbi:hypothetical protein ACWELO_30690 [Streptomyces sp. NPDC004596]